jgi:hypothetical protein
VYTLTAENYSRNTFPLSSFYAFTLHPRHYLFRASCDLTFRPCDTGFSTLVASSHQKRRPPDSDSFHLFWLFHDSWLWRNKISCLILQIDSMGPPRVCRFRRKMWHLLGRSHRKYIWAMHPQSNTSASPQSNSSTFDMKMKGHEINIRLEPSNPWIWGSTKTLSQWTQTYRDCGWWWSDFFGVAPRRVWVLMGLALVETHDWWEDSSFVFTLRVLTQLTLKFCKFNVYQKRKIGAF